MTEDTPVELDAHRGMAAQKSTEMRRHLHEVQADQAALRQRQEALEDMLATAPANTWAEASDKARYLLGLYAATPQAQDPRRQKLIADVLADFDRLSR
jgi:hypothetical protein